MIDDEPKLPEAAQIAILYERVRNMGVRIGEFVTKDEFLPIKLLVYGFTTVLLLAVMVAIVSLVVHK